MRHSLTRPLRPLLALLVVLTAAPPLWAAPKQDAVKPDARYYGFVDPSAPVTAGGGQQPGVNVELEEPGSVALTYLLLMVLGVLGIGVLFKSARRTHLD